jgi:hypothetical protein
MGLAAPAQGGGLPGLVGQRQSEVVDRLPVLTQGEIQAAAIEKAETELGVVIEPEQGCGGGDNRDDDKDHGDHAKQPGSHDQNCCGMFCLSALAPASGPVVEGLLLPEELSPPAETSFFIRTPDLPDRPPITLLVVAISGNSVV